MTRGNKHLPTRLVVIGGREYTKPWDFSCGACRSPHMISIDSCLAEGYSIRSIKKLLSGLKPAVPNEVILRAHIEHLAEPHKKARIAFEEAAEARGDDTNTVNSRTDDALAEIIRRGNELLVHGELEVGPRDMLAAIKLQAQLARERNGEGVESSVWQAAMMEFFELVQKYLDRNRWKAFVDDVYASPVIRQVLAEAQPALSGGTE